MMVLPKQVKEHEASEGANYTESGDKAFQGASETKNLIFEYVWSLSVMQILKFGWMSKGRAIVKILSHVSHISIS